MTRQDKQRYMEMPTVAVYSFGLAGLEIKAIEYGIEDYVIYIGTDKKIHRSRIYTAPSGQFYFRYGRWRICFDECMRV